MRERGTGVWLPVDFVEQLLRQKLRPASVFNVYLAICTTVYRYGGREARLSNGEIAEMTGLSKRSVTAAIKQLIKLGLVSRPTRYRKFALGQERKNKPKVLAKRDEGNSALRRRSRKFTSPMSLYVLNTLGTNIGFSENQIKLLATMFEEAHDAGVDLEFAEMIEASSFGVLGKRTFQAVFEHVTGSQEAIAAHRYVKMVKDFIRSEAIQGVELKLD